MHSKGKLFRGDATFQKNLLVLMEQQVLERQFNCRQYNQIYTKPFRQICKYET